MTAPLSPGLLGDTPARDYARKLRQFNAFAEPELRRLIGGAGVNPGARILDAGCGTGEALPWLLEAAKPGGHVVGIDLAAAHVEAARRYAGANIEVLQGDLLTAPIAPASIDFIWCVNTINHVRDPIQALNRLRGSLRPRGRVALGQSSLLPDMYFAWDSRLERVVNEAVREYYRGRYSLDERELTAVRALVGALRGANFNSVAAQTVMIERVSPLDPATECYLRESIFEQTWGERLRPHLSDDDYAQLRRICDPEHAGFALRRADFHFLQTFTLVMGET